MENNDGSDIKESKEFIETVVGSILRVIGILFLVFIYIAFIWYLEYRNGVEKFIGFSTLGVGILSIATPIKTIGMKNWLLLYTSFITGGVLLLVII